MVTLRKCEQLAICADLGMVGGGALPLLPARDCGIRSTCGRIISINRWRSLASAALALTGSSGGRMTRSLGVYMDTSRRRGYLKGLNLVSPRTPASELAVFLKRVTSGRVTL
ncbi:hypothetical protein NDU88_002434 [Pleurodeles waltl]|uniref:Uncharacterized protein n=1 Tax=Pleurodeles waltl TaxID=8319 RepID=A0AAV7KS54_PLEWA|nr:hypothetical protein NDU88_002434 [Pleurodeles waltl]